MFYSLDSELISDQDLSIALLSIGIDREMYT